MKFAETKGFLETKLGSHSSIFFYMYALAWFFHNIQKLLRTF